MIRIQKNILLVLMLFCVSSSFSMDLLKNCYGGVTKGVNWTFDTYSSGLESVEDVLHLPKTTLQAGIPVVTAASLAWYFTRSNDDIKKFIEHVDTAKKITLGCGALYSARFLKRWWDFSSLEKELLDASSPETAHYKKFRFATWAKSMWPLASNIIGAANAVRAKLKHDVTTCDDQVYLHGNKIDGKKPITAKMIKDSINTELEQLKKDLGYVGACTDAPEVLVSLLQQHPKAAVSDTVSSFINIADNINILQKSDLYFINSIKKASKANWFKRFVYFPGYQFWNFRFAPYYKRATNLYCDLLKNYIRLSALKSVADQMEAWEEKPKTPGHTVNVNFKKVN